MTYFVSYYWESISEPATVHGFGSAEIYRDKKVKSWKDIKELQKVVENRLALDDSHAVILNFQKLK